jgi:RimJ/RimL family protein N-acetyltransferase
MKRPTIKTEKFILRPFKMIDAPGVAEQANDKELAKYVGTIPHPYRVRDAENWLKKVIAEKYKKEPSQVDFCIEIEGRVAGSISLFNINHGHKAEIGYWLGKDFRRGGVMTRAIKEVCEFGFDSLGVKRIYAAPHADNTSSHKVLEKAGFEQEGILKKEAKREDGYMDSYLMARVK